MSQTARSPRQIGSILRQRREAKSLTQSALAGLAGLRQATISDVESGREGSKLSTLLEILAALDLELTISERRKDTPKLEDLM
jgi:HTH-type transcriptional regulator/antitoxin HipB